MGETSQHLSDDPSDARGDAPGAPVIFDAVLAPSRSLGRMGFIAVMAGVIVVSVGLGTYFLLQGAWPVFGFFGLDIALVYLAFRLSYRSGRLREFLRVTADEVAVRRVAPNGRTTEWRFNPIGSGSLSTTRWSTTARSRCLPRPHARHRRLSAAGRAGEPGAGAQGRSRRGPTGVTATIRRPSPKLHRAPGPSARTTSPSAGCAPSSCRASPPAFPLPAPRRWRSPDRRVRRRGRPSHLPASGG